MKVVRSAVAALAFAGLGLAAAPALAQDYGAMSCEQLWYERNSIYKGFGYCFKTDRAISTFGNDGCYVYDESRLQLTSEARRRIGIIVSIEKQRYCR